MNIIKKITKVLLVIALISVSVYPVVNATNPGVIFETRKDTLTTGQDLITVIVKAKNIRFNDFNMSIKYDQENLIPADFEFFTPVEKKAKDVLRNLQPTYIYHNPQTLDSYGWVKSNNMTMDRTLGILDYHIEVHPDSKGVESGSDLEGFITAGQQGLGVVRFSFLVKEGAVIDKNSIQLLRDGMPGGIAANPYGISITTDSGKKDEDLDVNFVIPDDIVTPTPVPPEEPEIKPEEPEVRPEEPEIKPEEPEAGPGEPESGPGEPILPPVNNEVYTPYVNGVSSAVVYNSRFNDVSGHWAEQSIINVQDVFDIYSGDGLYPERYATKAEIATILCEVLGLKESKKSYFVDIDGHIAENSINTLYYSGIVSGELDKTYRPDSLIEREELATMLSKAIKFEKDITNFTFIDDDEISDWAKKYIYSIREKNILNGYPDGTVRPREYVSRAELAVIVDNLVKYLKNA